MSEIPLPDDSLAGLSDAEQVELIEQTDNRLSPEDAGVPQPPVPDPGTVSLGDG